MWIYYFMWVLSRCFTIFPTMTLGPSECLPERFKKMKIARCLNFVDKLHLKMRVRTTFFFANLYFQSMVADNVKTVWYSQYIILGIVWYNIKYQAPMPKLWLDFWQTNKDIFSRKINYTVVDFWGLYNSKIGAPSYKWLFFRQSRWNFSNKNSILIL